MFGGLFKRRAKSDHEAHASGGQGEPGALTPVAALAHVFESGSLPCQHCGWGLSLGPREPLTLIKCPQCRTPMLVPMRIGSYWLFEPAGGGGMGSVFKAVNTRARDQLFAVKIVARRKRTDPDAIAALQTEATIGAAVSGHPNLVCYIGGGCLDGEHYAAMHFVSGRRLDNIILRGGRMPQPAVITLARQVLSADRFVWERGFLYRDLKPQNVVLSDEDGRAVVLDCGLCIPRGDASAPRGDFALGSPFYVPPERLYGLPENMAGEIYSLGMVMIHALTGKTLWSASEAELLEVRNQTTARLSLAGMVYKLAPAVVAILDRMIRQAPAERYQDFDALDADLAKIEQESA